VSPSAIAEAKPRRFRGYGFRMSRDKPVLWATRYDIVFAFVVVASIGLPILMTAIDQLRGINLDVIARLMIAAMITFACAILWMYARFNTLSLPFSPNLRRIPWSIEAHIGMWLFVLPSVLLFYASDFTQRDHQVVFAVAYAIGSFLACLMISARVDGLQQSIVDAIAVVVQALAWTFLFATFRGQVGGLALLIGVYITLAVLLSPLRKTRMRNLLLFKPALYAASFGPIVIVASNTTGLGGSNANLAQFTEKIILLTVIYACVAVLNEIVYRFISRNREIKR
jgi:hypothetical protein